MDRQTAKALELADQLEVSEGERALVKRRIPEAAQGDLVALGYVTRFFYDGKHNRGITSLILDLIR